MTQTALWELQKAVYAALSVDSKLTQLVSGVYDVVEEDLAFPYLTIGAPSTLNIETRNTFSEEVSLTIHSWSVAGGKKESYALLDAIHQAIGKGIAIGGSFSLLKISRPQLQVIDDADPRIKHGLARFTFTIKNN